MSANFKQLFETSYLQVSTRLTEMQRIFATVRTFSLKTNSHLKVLCNLVNDLIDSEDTLHLVDTEINIANIHSHTRYELHTKSPKQKTPNSFEFPASSQTININLTDTQNLTRNSQFPEKNIYDTATKEVTNVEHNHYASNKTATNNGNNDRMIDEIIQTFRQENANLWDLLRKGETDAEFVKTVLHQFLDNYTSQMKSQKDNDEPSMRKNGTIMHNHHCNCITSCCYQNHFAPGQGPFAPKVSNPSFYTAPNLTNYQSMRKARRYSNRFGSEAEDEFDDDIKSVKSFKIELAKLNSNIKKLKDGKEQHNAVQDMLKKYIDLKFENEKLMKEKDARIAGLEADLKNFQEKLDVVEYENSHLRSTTRDLQNKLFESMKPPTGNSIYRNDSQKGFSAWENSQDRQRMEEEFDDLRQENKELKEDVERLKDRLYKAGKDRTESEKSRMEVLKLQRELQDAEEKADEFRRKNEDLRVLLERKGSNRPNQYESDFRIVAKWETNLTSPYDDFLKCIYAQADHIESSLQGNFQTSEFTY